MCGLLGCSINLKIGSDQAYKLLKSRGPDDFSHFTQAGFTVFHSRLAIVGVNSSDSTQPIRQGKSTLVCNGFISNYEEIYRSLGVTALESDCAAILHLYNRRGIAGLKELRGQFAAVIIDEYRQRLVLVRDHTGICPLYFLKCDGNLIFASQASWLHEIAYGSSIAIDTIIDEPAYENWVSSGYAVGPRTLIRGVSEVEAGTVEEFSLADINTSVVHHIRCFESEASPEPVEDVVRESIFRSVARNLQGDFPPWILISGGLDSTLVLHCARTLGAAPSLVTLSYPEGENEEELEQAVEISNYYGCKLNIIDFPNRLAAPQPDLLKGRVDWPLDGGSLLPKLILADYIRSQGGRVVLGGTGADELFGGYRRHRARLGILQNRNTASDEEEYAYFKQWIAPHGSSETAFSLFLLEKELKRFADPAFIYDLLELSQLHNPRVDSCFANVGIEYRPVFEDFDIQLLAAQLPLSVKSSANLPKRILRKAFEGSVPERFLNVPKRPLRFGIMGPTLDWRLKIFDAWAASRL